MAPIFFVAVFAVTPFYKPTPPSNNGNHAPHVTHDHRRGEHHRRYYGGGYIDSYDQPDTSGYDATDEDEPLAHPAVVYRPEPATPAVEEKLTFPTYTEIVVKGAPIGNGCTYKSVMSDDEINACKRVVRNELNQAR
jgi:hypothetical protein